MSATKPGFSTDSATSIVVTDGGTTTQDFALSDAADSACLTDTTQADFLTGVGTNVDINTSPGDVMLTKSANLDQQNTAWHYSRLRASGLAGLDGPDLHSRQSPASS